MHENAKAATFPENVFQFSEVLPFKISDWMHNSKEQ